MVASVGTPLLQQILLTNNAVLDNIEETPDLEPLTAGITPIGSGRKGVGFSMRV